MADPLLVKAYCQINTVKGWRYLDDAGKVMNEFTDDFDDMRVGPAGLSLTKPGAVLDEARVSGNSLWVGFTRPATATLVGDQAWRIFQFCLTTFGVTTVSRVGARFQYLVPGVMGPERMGQLARELIGEGLRGVEGEPTSGAASIELRLAGGLAVTWRIEPVQLSRPAGMEMDLPTEGVLFDADVSKSEAIAVGQTRAALRQAIHWADATVPALARSFAPRVGLG